MKLLNRERKAVTKYLIKGEHSALKPKEFEKKIKQKYGWK